MTAGTAGMVDEEETSSEERTQPPSSTNNIDGAASPNAMDIDTPPPPQPASAGSNGARNIPVEPSRKEWRAGDANGGSSGTLGSGLANGVKVPEPFKASAAGSEDSEEFLRSSMFAKTELFNNSPTGLNSFVDMQSNLPFQSKASAAAPVEKKARKPLAFPAPPVPPRCPPTTLAISGLRPAAASWAKYVREFNLYMMHWADFNGLVTDHFAARKRQIDEQRKHGGFGWLDAKGDAGIEEYLQWVEEDREVRQQWMAACEGHELALREFRKHRQHMNQ